MYQRRVLSAMEREIRIISHGQSVSTQRNHITILKEHSLPVKKVLHSIKRLLVWYFWSQCTLTSGTFRVECKCVVCTEAVQLEGLMLKVFIHIDLTIGITIDDQQDATILIYLLLISSTCFGRCFRPSSGAYHCNYRFWYCPTQHRPATTLVDNTRSCSYSDMFLMMDENIARNM